MSERAGPLPRALAPLSLLAAQGYGAVVALRNRAFDRGRGVRVLACEGQRVPVISVGNLIAGGTGKSPFVAWICGELAAHGYKPVIAMRGYRGARNAHGVLESDEAREYATTAPAAHVVVHPRRYEALQSALASPLSREWRARAVVVLDDGFQHRQLARDLDIVLVDHTPMTHLLPHGWLREPVHAVARAHLVIGTKGASASTVLAGISRGFDAQCVHAWTQLEVYEGGAARSEPCAWLRDRCVVTACGLGNPAHFETMAREHGARVVESLRVGDHRRLTPDALESAIARARAASGGEAIHVLMTRKDFVKLKVPPSVAVVVPTLALAFTQGMEVVQSAVTRVASCRTPAQ